MIQLPIWYKIIYSVLALIVVIIVRTIILQGLRQYKKKDKAQKRQLYVVSRNIVYSILSSGLIVLWFAEIRAIITGILVIAVAFVIATKELFLNVTGALFRASSRFISIGDRIEIDGFRGDVIDQTLTGVTLLEIGPGTNQYSGKNVFIPNIKFLSSSVINETRLKNYVFHVIYIPLKDEDHWQHAEKVLLEIADEIVEPYKKDLVKYMAHLSDKYSLDMPAVEPRVHIQIKEPGKLTLALRIPVPIQKRGRLEQHILREYLCRKQISNQ